MGEGEGEREREVAELSELCRLWNSLDRREATSAPSLSLVTGAWLATLLTQPTQAQCELATAVTRYVFQLSIEHEQVGPRPVTTR